MDSGSHSRWWARPTALGAAGIALLGAIPFFAATTFTGDDHLFLAFARHVRNPLVAFTTDMHGGEFYRPLPMLLWWLLGRAAGGATWPFATFAFLLHLMAAVETAALLGVAARDQRAAFIAGCVFFLAPATREAAYWYAASTDLLAVTLGLGALLLALARRRTLSNVLLLGACFSKESATVVPLLAVLVHRMRDPERPWTASLRAGLSLLPAAVVAVAARTLVLRGIGGSGDATAPLGRKLAQIAAGLVEAGAAGDALGQPLAVAVGLGAWLFLLGGVVLGARRSGWRGEGLIPLAWIAVTVLPLLAAPWIVGARYFYFALVAIAWLWARTLSRRSPLLVVAVLACLAGLSFAQASARRADVVSYDGRVTVIRRAVLAGLAQGHQTFHVACGIKDIDLAVKEDPRLAPEVELVVLGDVPASFVSLPASGASRVDFLLAEPPLPPIGAYRFGDRRIAALARRGDDPALDEVMARLPDLRLIRLRLGPGGRIVYRDVTESLGALGADE